jgi:hypothetical protein
MPKPNLHFAFDHTSPEAEAYARERSAALLSTLADREAVRSVVGRSFSENMSPARAAREIRSIVGLLPRQYDAVRNLRSLLDPMSPKYAGDGALVFAGRTRIRIPDDGMDEDLIDQRCEEYGERLLNQRCRMIARTELLGASNAGTQEAWQQAVDEGLLTGEERREWLYVSGLDKVPCEICSAMDGQRVGLDEPFITPDGDEIMNPPAHPNCRCGQGLVTEAERAREIEEEQASGEASARLARLARLARIREDFPSGVTYEEWRDSIIRELGGPGSGFFGHAGRPGEVGGSSEGGEAGGGDKKRDDQQTMEEKRVVTNRLSEFREKERSSKRERFIFLDKSGKTLLDKKGESHQVLFGQKDIDAGRGAHAVIHNHPLGGPFSGMDLELASMVQPGAMLVTSRHREYELLPDKHGVWPSVNEVLPFYQGQKEAELSRLAKRKKKLKDQQALVIATHRAIMATAERFGLSYSMTGDPIVEPEDSR